MTTYNWNEIMQFALAIEDNGERFYRQLEQQVDGVELKQFFRRMANEEVGHGRVFADLIARWQDHEPEVEQPEEYYAYLRAFVDNVAFSPERFEEVLASVKEPLTAVRFAKQREQDTVHFYLELKELVPPADRDLVEEIVREERRHFVRLTEIETELVASAASSGA